MVLCRDSAEVELCPENTGIMRSKRVWTGGPVELAQHAHECQQGRCHPCQWQNSDNDDGKKMNSRMKTKKEVRGGGMVVGDE